MQTANLFKHLVLGGKAKDTLKFICEQFFFWSFLNLIDLFTTVLGILC